MKLNRETAIRSLFALIGVLILSLGAATLRVSGSGLDPFTAANTGISQLLGLSLGVYQLMINIVILVGVFFLGRKYIGIGTIINMVLVGFAIDFFTWFYGLFLPETLDLFGKIILLIMGILLFTFGASLYMSPKLGNAPYDSIAPIIVDRTKFSYKIVRVIQDLSFMAIALFSGGDVGIATIINAFFTGPLITIWNKKVSEPLIEKNVRKNG